MTSKKQRLVMGFGTFDGVHPGHLFYLSELKKLGDELVMVIARDANVERIKGKPPLFNEEERRMAILKTGIPDEVVLGNETDFFKVLRDLGPDVLGFGYDQWADMETIRKQFPTIEMVRLEAHEPEKYKSSIIKQRYNETTL